MRDINVAAEKVMKMCIDTPNDPARGGRIAKVGKLDSKERFMSYLWATAQHPCAAQETSLM